MDWIQIIIRFSLAILFGLLIGMERERLHRPAGIKTHILVCVGAALVSLMQLQLQADIVKQIGLNPELGNALKADPGRLGAQVISGIGFLGAGTILRNKGIIQGLTTAATLWLTACVGLAVGMGYYKMSIAAIVLILTVMTFLKIIQTRLEKTRGRHSFEIKIADKAELARFLRDYCALRGISILGIDYIESQKDLEKPDTFVYIYHLILPRTADPNQVMIDWQMEENILSATLSTAAE